MMRLTSRLTKPIFITTVFVLLVSVCLASRSFVASALTEPQVLRGHTDAVSSIDVSHDGRVIATGSLDHTVRLWDTQTGRTTRIFQAHKDEVYAVAFSPDDRMLASSSYDGRVILWDVNTGKLLRTLQITGWSVAVAFSSDGSQLAVASQKRNIFVYDVRTGSILRTMETRGAMNVLAFSPDGRYLASGSYAIGFADAKTGRVSKSLQGHRGSVRGIAFSKDGRFLASASADKTARLWDVETGATIKTFETTTPIAASYAPQPIQRKMPVTAVAFSPDGKLLAMTTGRAIHLWDVATGNQVRTLEGHAESVTGVVFLPAGNSLASSSLDGTVRIWSLGSQP